MPAGGPLLSNDQYRIVFDWNDGPDAVELTDYHR